MFYPVLSLSLIFFPHSVFFCARFAVELTVLAETNFFTFGITRTFSSTHRLNHFTSFATLTLTIVGPGFD